MELNKLKYTLFKALISILWVSTWHACAVNHSENTKELPFLQNEPVIATNKKNEPIDNAEYDAILKNNFEMSAGELSEEQRNAFRQRAHQKLSDYFDIIIELMTDTSLQKNDKKNELKTAAINLFYKPKNKVLAFGINSQGNKRTTIELFINEIKPSNPSYISLPFKTDSIATAEYKNGTYQGCIYFTLTVNDQDIQLKNDYIIDKAIKTFGYDEEIIWNVYLGNQSFIK